MLIVALCEGSPGNSGSGDGEDSSDGEAGQDFEAAVAIRVVGIGGLGRDPKAEQDQAGHEDVGGGFEAVGHQGDGVGGEADRDFYGGESRADRDADHRCAAGGLFEAPHASDYSVDG